MTHAQFIAGKICYNSSGSLSIDVNDVGHILWEMYLKKGYLKLDGSSLLSASTDFNELLTFAQENSLITSVSTDNSKFKYDNNTDTLILPNFINKGLWGGSTVEEKIAGLPNITGFSHTGDRRTHIYGEGAFYTYNNAPSNLWAAMSDTDGNIQGLGFDASRSNAIYGRSSTVQPPAIQLIPQIKYTKA